MNTTSPAPKKINIRKHAPNPTHHTPPPVWLLRLLGHLPCTLPRGDATALADLAAAAALVAAGAFGLRQPRRLGGRWEGKLEDL